MKPITDLLVIGAGWAGLYAAKYAREAGLEVTLLERRADLGGVWNYSDDPATITVMRNTVSSSSRHVTEASDLSMGSEAGTFFRHQDALAFLRRYAERFGLTERIVTGARVARARKIDGLWQVETEDGRSFRVERLAVATGVHQRPRPITGPVADFTGALVHTAELKHPLDLGVGAGDHVIVYGGGETAADIVHDLASETGADLTWAVRGGQHFFRKAPLRRGQPPGFYARDDMALDEYSSGLIGLMTTPQKAARGMRHLGNLATSGSVFSYQGHGVAEWQNDLPLYRQFFNKNGHALEHVWNGRVTPARGIARCVGDRVVFEDGREVRASHIVCCFGYQPDFSFLPEELAAVPTDRLHRLVFHPDDPSLAFFGFARPTILSLPYMIELQCIYAARVWSGRVVLPGAETMHAEAEADAAALDALLGYARSNPNITCPFWYLEVMMKAMQEDSLRQLFARFDPRRDWGLFSRAVRVPASPLLLRLMTSDAVGSDERARMDEYVSPMPFGFRRRDVSLLRYVLTYGLMIGLSRLLWLDELFDVVARRRIARRGRSLASRPASTGVTP
ncbi:flavin-containing monooxygenase [Halochromatium sp.]